MVALNGARVTGAQLELARRILDGEPVVVPGWAFAPDHPVWRVVRDDLLALGARGWLPDRDPQGRIALALADLQRNGESRQRRRAGDASLPVDPAQDQRIGRLWSQVIERPDQESLRAFEVEYRPDIARVLGFVALQRGRKGTRETQLRVRGKLLGAFLLALAEGWVEVALRALLVAAVPDAPALVEAATARQALGMAVCVAGRRSWGGTIRALQPGIQHLPSWEGRMARALTDDPAVVVRWIDAHLLRRLIDSLPERGAGPGVAVDLMDQNEAKALTRLRAAMGPALEGEVLQGLLSRSAGLHFRTGRAIFQFAASWAHAALEAGLEDPVGAVATPPCAPGTAGPLAPRLVTPLRAWLLRLALLGRLPALEDWLWRQTPGSGAFARLLLAAPPPLRAERYHPLRRELAAHLDHHLAALRGPLEATAAIAEPGPAAVAAATGLSLAGFSGPALAQMVDTAAALLATPFPGLPDVG